MRPLMKRVGKKILYMLWIIAALSIAVLTFRGMDAKSLFFCLKNLLGIACGICVGSFVECVLEASPWAERLVSWPNPLMKFARLPKISHSAFTLAFFSGLAANTMIARNYIEKKITRREMIFSGICNAYPSSSLDYLRMMFPVMGAIGIAGFFYFSIIYCIGFAITVTMALICRFSGGGEARISDCSIGRGIERHPLSIKRILSTASRRTMKFLPRILLLTLPLYLLTAYAGKAGLFDSMQKSIPVNMRQYLSPEIVSVICARLGGIFSASGVAAELLGRGQIMNWQVAYALLIGNMLTFPMRMARRSIPSAMGIFPGYDGLIIVFSLQAMRIFFTLAAILLMIAVFGS